MDFCQLDHINNMLLSMMDYKYFGAKYNMNSPFT